MILYVLRKISEREQNRLIIYFSKATRDNIETLFDKK